MVLILHYIYKTQLYPISLAVGLDCDLYITACYVFSTHMKGSAVEWAILDCTFVDWLSLRTCDGPQAIVCSRLPASVSAAGTGAKTEGWWGGSAADIPPPKTPGLGADCCRLAFQSFLLTHIYTDLQPLFPERQELRPASCDSPLSCGHFLVFGCRYWSLVSYTAALRGSFKFTTD